MDLDRYSRRAEAFNSTLARAYYRHYAGLNENFDQAETYRRHADLFAPDVIDRLRVPGAATAQDTSRRRRALLRFAVEGSIGSATARLDAELARREATLSVEVPSLPPGHGVDRLGVGEALTMLAAEPDPARRAEIDLARRRAVDETLRPLAEEALQQRHDQARQLGWRSYAELCAELAGIDLGELEAQARSFLADTEAGYAGVLEGPVRAVLGLTAAALRRCDLPRLLRNPRDDAHFPSDRLLPVAATTLGDLGLALRPNVVLDVERRAGKSTRAFCVPVRIPEEILLVLAPVGGRADYRALLHETGHAQHFAGADRALPFELRRLGDPAVGEAFAFLFEGLVDDPDWRRRHLDGGDGDTVAHARAQRLLLLRRYAAKLSYERELHGTDTVPGADLSAAYARRLSAAVGVDWPAESWVTDVDPGMYVISYLRGWALESSLRRALRERFGASWFAHRGAGRLLRELWREGQRLRAEELLARVDPGARLDFAALASDFGSRRPAAA